MKRITYNTALALYERTMHHSIDQVRAPAPFCGRTTPTRVAWYIVTGNREVMRTYVNPNFTPDGAHGQQYLVKTVYTPRVVHTYAGKPSRLRALEALALLRTHPIEFWQIEFDQAGVIAWKRFTSEKSSGATSNAYLAYHPHSRGSDIIAGFAKQFYVKRIGRMSVYSHAKKLAIDKLDAFYAWYEQTFGRKLKRPRQEPMEVESGGTQDVAIHPQAKAVETPGEKSSA